MGPGRTFRGAGAWRNTNILELLNREVSPPVYVVPLFPEEASVLKLVGSVPLISTEIQSQKNEP
ncbi:MAG: transposase [Planctomycetes bacterium]|nr:transposase [Planctomycetota bacterium]